MQLSDSQTSLLVNIADWQPHHAHMTDATYISSPLAASTLAPLSSTTPTQRRRSAILRPPPSAPPPTQPIPSIPPLETPAPDVHSQFVTMNDYNTVEIPNVPYFARPAPSPNLVSVATFSQNQARHLYSTQGPPLSIQTSSSTMQNVQPQGQGTAVDHLRSPHPSTPRTSEQRPSSRRTLTKALELAREAVRLDSTNDDPYGAIVAYGKSVALLSKVMDRVMRGEESTDRRRGGRRRSVVAQEEEIRRLRAIHDTYAERMNILSLIYDIPAVPQSPNALYQSVPISASNSTTSTRPPSPSQPSSPIPDHPPLSQSSRERQDEEREDRRFSTETAKFNRESLTNEYFSSNDDTSLPYHHPYAASSQSSISDDGRTSYPAQSAASPPPAVFSQTRPLSSRFSRPRATSTLPPPPPPPTNALPPAPDQVHPPPDHLLTVSTRPRGASVNEHAHNLSGNKLESLEEREESPLQTVQRAQFSNMGTNDVDETAARLEIPVTVRDPNRDSHPLPPLPVSAQIEHSAVDLATPRTQTVEPEPLGAPARVNAQRPRGTSTVSTRPESPSKYLINASTNLGTISIRRSKQPAPPSSNGSPRLSEAAPPAVLKLAQVNSRNRANSQPGQRPNMVGLPSVSPFDTPNRPSSTLSGLPITAVPRKQSVSSKPPLLPQIQVVNDSLSPPLATPMLSVMTQLVPPPPIPHGHLPTTPISPLPPAAPTDTLRKPYHMMNLLRHTMTSKSGGYITRRLHVPQGVWSQGGAKLQNLPDKVRVVEYICSALEELQNTSGDAFGHGNVSTGLGLGIGSVGRKEGDMWSAKLEEFSSVCDGVVSNFGKKLGVGEGFVTKKSGGVTSWGGKLTRQFDKLTNQKNLDSPASYVQALSRLFLSAQLLDEHCKAITMSPLAPTYAALPMDVRLSIESKLRRSSEFFASVVLTFVVRDLAQLLEKYVKKCEKWLAE